MARKRMIDPCIWESEDFAKLSFFARLVWIGLFSNADDAGRGKGNSAYIKSQIFAYDDKLTVKEIDNALAEIEKIMSVRFYEVDGKRYYQLENWHKFQTINRPTPSQIPEENKGCDEHSLNTHGVITEQSQTNQTQVNDGSLPKKEIEKEQEIKENSLTGVKESEDTSLSPRSPKHKYGAYKNVLLTADEYDKLVQMPNGTEAIEFFSEYRETKGYKCKRDFLAIKRWVFDAVKEQQQRRAKINGSPGQAKSGPPETKGVVTSAEAAVWMT